MNPRVVLLLAIAALFIAAWELDARHQSATILARKQQSRAAVAQVELTNPSRTVSLLEFETSTDRSEADAFTLVKHQMLPVAVETSVVETTGAGWECSGASIDNSTNAAKQTTQVSAPPAATVSMATTLIESEYGADDPHADYWDFNCNDDQASNDEIPMCGLWMFGGTDVALPAEITAGEYRLVSDRGEVRSLVLSPADLGYHGLAGRSLPRDMYSVDVNGSRWYFIRLKQNETIESPTTAAIDWSKSMSKLQTWARTNVQFTVWQWSGKWNYAERRIEAFARQSQKYTVMAQAIWHAIQSIDSAKRISAEEPTDGIRF